MNAAVPVIEMSGVVKSYPTGFFRKRVTVLSNLSFSVGRNEIVGFLGPNGAGKTTTIKLLTRLAFPDSGRIAIFGEEPGRAEVRRRIGYMPEQPYFYEYLTGAEFLGLCGHLSGLAPRAIRERTAQALARVGLDGAGEISIRKYSKGMMQRLGLAQALLHDPELLILDEPMSGLDPVGRVEVRNLILDLKRAGKTVFFSTHIISDVEALCDRVIMLRKGRKVAEGAIEELVGGEGVKYFELQFAPAPPPEWLAAAGLPPGSGSTAGSACVVRASGQAEANVWIAKFREGGALLRSCVPVRKSLEDIYVEHVAGGRTGGREGEA